MNTITKKYYQLPLVERVILDSDISLTLDSANGPIGDPEMMFFNTESFSSDPNGFEIL